VKEKGREGVKGLGTHGEHQQKKSVPPPRGDGAKTGKREGTHFTWKN